MYSRRETLDIPRPSSRPLLDSSGSQQNRDIDQHDSDSDEYVSACPTPDVHVEGDDFSLDTLFQRRPSNRKVEFACRASVYETPPAEVDDPTWNKFFNSSKSDNISLCHSTDANPVDQYLPQSARQSQDLNSEHRDIKDLEESNLNDITTNSRPVSDIYSSVFEDNSVNKPYLDADTEDYDLALLFDRQRSSRGKKRAVSTQIHRHSLPPPQDQPDRSPAMSYQSTSEPCHMNSEDSGDPSVSRRLLDLVNALADNLGQTPERGTASDKDDILSGCQINLAFEDTEPDLPFDPRYLDITQSDFDHLPWYFQDSEDDLSNLIYPGGELPSKRPHSIAVPNELTGNENDFMRGHPSRATVGAIKGVNSYHVPDRPVSATEITGICIENTTPTVNEPFTRSHPSRSTIGVPSRHKGSQFSQNLQENSAISESPEFSRNHAVRSTVCVPNRGRENEGLGSRYHQKYNTGERYTVFERPSSGRSTLTVSSESECYEQPVYESSSSSDEDTECEPTVPRRDYSNSSRQTQLRPESAPEVPSTMNRLGSTRRNHRRISADESSSPPVDNRMSVESSDEIDWSWVAGEAQRLQESEMGQIHNSETVVLEQRHFHPSAPPEEEDEEEDGVNGEERPSSWLRASMRRVQHFHLGEPPRVRSAPPESIQPLPPLGAQVVPTLETTGPTLSSPPAPVRDFPRRYSGSPARCLEVATPSSSSSTIGDVRRTRRRSSPARRRSSSCSSHRRRHSSPRPSSSSDSSDDVPAATTAVSTDSPNSPTQPDSGSDSDHPTPRPCDGRSSMADAAQSPLGHWPHNLSSMLASLGCTLGLFNISRFAILSVQFGANFILQFLFVSLVLGIPLYTFHASIGQFLAAGIMDMWKISPIFQGIGIALLVSHALIGIYSIVGVSWMFIFFRDSFITRQDQYRWAEPSDLYRFGASDNGSSKLEHTVPDYFNGVVLQRHNLESENTFGHLKFQVTFNLAVVWMIVFVSLSKGLKSYGKVVYVFSLFPVFGMLILCTKLLGLTATNAKHQVFPETVWSEFFLNTKCWVAASTEAIFTWGLLGAAITQIASHNRHKHLLHRDVSLVVILTLAILLLSAFLANTCVQLLASSGYHYIPSSFEQMSTYLFLHPDSTAIPAVYVTTPVRYMTHSTFIAGTRVILPNAKIDNESGYQVLRLATELVPSTFALLGADQVSPFWAVLFYFVLILFGIAQQLAIWHSVITGIMAINATNLKSWETTITFFSCACGFILGLPMTTELGIHVVYFMDYTVGCGWWLMVLYLIEIGAVFVIRGRPYNGENVVTTLFNKGVGCLQVWAAPMLVFTWNVILPVALMVICITVFKNGRFREMYNWSSMGLHYWPLWLREIGCLLQLMPIIAIPVVGIVQSCRYLSSGPPDLFDRIQLLYRPPMETEDSREQARATTTTSTASANTTNGNAVASPVTEAPFEDPPPKYTPPPSYTTATGARIAKLLRQSFRRSMRRITSVLGDNSESFGSSSPGTRPPLPPPPDYAAVLVEINQALESRDRRNSERNRSVAISVTDVDSIRTSTVSTNSNTTGQTLPNSRHPSDTRMSTLTAADVAHILRSSLRRTLRHGSMRGDGNEQLVHGAAPISNEPQAKSEQDNSTSVI
ncbi:sodium-dependent transporter bedraggled [Anabrus simplex]|uniref:sodium-dependent transporter bedraggled n=1 Tax=Anabrus simplex TaxID=316456 RepID=UPI0035A2F8C0